VAGARSAARRGDQALPGRKFIFTNGDRGHAERTARQLGILDHFDDIFDIVAAGLTPKPARKTYDRFVACTASRGRTRRCSRTWRATSSCPRRSA
jgi:FMN phosphatase YigB (HAD superfamily)